MGVFDKYLNKKKNKGDIYRPTTENFFIGSPEAESEATSTPITLDQFFEDYLDISNTSYEFTKYLKKYNFDYILMPKKRGITTYLSESNDYNVIYSDKKVVIFKAK